MKGFFSDLMQYENLVNQIIAISIAFFGGITKFFMKEEYTIWKFLISIFASGFSGWICYLICKELNISSNLTAVICGIGGFSGENVLELLQEISVKWTKRLLSINNAITGVAKDAENDDKN